MSNPLSCNCHLQWFSEWLKSRDVLAGTLKCYFPRELRDTAFLDVPAEKLICQGNSDHKTALRTVSRNAIILYHPKAPK